MQKEKLKKLDLLYATPKMIRKATENEDIKITAKCHVQNGILVICVFYRDDLLEGIKEPLYVIYIDKKEGKWVNLIAPKGQEKKWSTAKAMNLGKIGTYYNFYTWYWYKEKKKECAIESGARILQKYLNTEHKEWQAIEEWQDKARKSEIERKEIAEQRPWDQDMELIPEIPEAFKKWMTKEVVSEYFIFYHYQRGGAKEAYCSHCQKMVPIRDVPHHNRVSKCPVCGRRATYKADTRLNPIKTLYYHGEIIQKIKDGIVIRTFGERHYYKQNYGYENPVIDLNEDTRIMLMDDGRVKKYDYTLYKNKITRWCQEKGYVPEKVTYYTQRSIKLYRKNMTTLKKGKLKNSSVWMWEILPTSVTSYLAVEKCNPAIEKLAKIKMFNLAQDLMGVYNPYDYVNKKETELDKILKIDNARLKRLKAMNGRIKHLMWLQTEKLVNTTWPDQMIDDLANAGLKGLNDFGYLDPPINVVMIWNYMKKQSALSGDNLYQVNSTWRDYLAMAEQLKFNTKIKKIWKPKNLKAAHTEMVDLSMHGEMKKEAKALEKKWKKVNGFLPDLEKFNYSDKDYLVRAPKDILDIVREGRILTHCVHNCDFYYDRIQKHEAYIFFLRRAKAPDTPWYTLEVEASGNIRQKRTTGDNQEADLDEAIKFLKKWQQIFIKRMTAEEKELGIKADQARKEEYAKLREEGKKVWHGKLAGKLLADVLEADFLAADLEEDK
ncbi:MAG: PcfJ domain-containing protein [Lachnospiraceae bacterium]|nr:PcfJ domain-containing protein [Lachnospiraceae bacterium]